MITSPTLSPTLHHWTWSWQNKPIKICYETWGEGEPLLLLPALSTVSSRKEMETIATTLLEKIPNRYQLIALDWPGFGDSERPRLAYQPQLYQQFLQDFVRDRLKAPTAVIAAGHSAGYVMAIANEQKDLWSKIVLVAPTWRGPLAVMGASDTVRRGVRNLVRAPLIGQFFYGLNTRPSFLKWMYRRHVFVDEARLTDDFISQRYQNTQQPGARYAPAAFVTGGLDSAQTRTEFLGYFEGIEVPVMALVAEQAPPSSKAEMEAIAELPQVQVQRMAGTLGMAEEYGADVGAAIATSTSLNGSAFL